MTHHKSCTDPNRNRLEAPRIRAFRMGGSGPSRSHGRVALALSAAVTAALSLAGNCPGQTTLGTKSDRLNLANQPAVSSSVAIQAPRVGNSGSGTLVAPNMVLTAAHVVHGLFQPGSGPVYVFVPFPASFPSGSGHPGSKSGQYYQIKSALIHPEWKPDETTGLNPENRAYDLALIELGEPVDIGITPSDVASSSFDPLGQTFSIAGFGKKAGVDFFGPIPFEVDVSENGFERGAGSNVIDAVDGPDGRVLISDADLGLNLLTPTGDSTPVPNETKSHGGTSGAGLKNENGEVFAVHGAGSTYYIPFLGGLDVYIPVGGQDVAALYTKEIERELLETGTVLSPPSYDDLERLLSPQVTPDAVMPAPAGSSPVDEAFADVADFAARMSAGLDAHLQTTERASALQLDEIDLYGPPEESGFNPMASSHPPDEFQLARHGDILDEVFGDLASQSLREIANDRKEKKNKKDKEGAADAPAVQDGEPGPKDEPPLKPTVVMAPTAPSATKEPPPSQGKPVSANTPKEKVQVITPDVSACLKILNDAKKYIEIGTKWVLNPNWTPDDWNTNKWKEVALTPSEKGDALLAAYDSAFKCYALLVTAAANKAAELKAQGVQATMKAPPFPSLDEYLGADKFKKP